MVGTEVAGEPAGAADGGADTLPKTEISEMGLPTESAERGPGKDSGGTPTEDTMAEMVGTETTSPEVDGMTVEMPSMMGVAPM